VSGLSKKSKLIQKVIKQKREQKSYNAKESLLTQSLHLKKSIEFLTESSQSKLKKLEKKDIKFVKRNIANIWPRL